MKYVFLLCALLVMALTPISAQTMASAHAPSAGVKQPSANAALPQVTGKPVARVNNAVLTDRDLLREMYTIFPYARQHNGKFPPEMEANIRSGALKMIIFEELVYQEALRRNMTIPPAKLDQAVLAFRKQFKSPDDYKYFIKTEGGGSEQALRNKIKRSMLIDALLKQDVQAKSLVTMAQVKAYYDKNPDKFRTPETFTIQTISMLPPANATPEQVKDARKRANDALKQAKATKDYETFGMLAEKVSEDDFRVMMGDHKAVDRANLPPEVVKALLAMQPGQVSDVIEFGGLYTIVRLNAHNPAGLPKFEAVQSSLTAQLQKQKSEELRASLDKKLRANAKVETL